MTAPQKGKEEAKASAKLKPAPKTVTCPHCRYEHPAKDKRCHICGYPWPWMKH